MMYVLLLCRAECSLRDAYATPLHQGMLITVLEVDSTLSGSIVERIKLGVSLGPVLFQSFK